MYLWNIGQLATDIKENTITDDQWKNYCIVICVLVCIVMWQPGMMIAHWLEALAQIVVTIFGIQLTYETSKKSGASALDYIARTVALSLPLCIRFAVFSTLVSIGVLLVGGATHALEVQWSIELGRWMVNEWGPLLQGTMAILFSILWYWRLNVHLKSINSLSVDV